MCAPAFHARTTPRPRSAERMLTTTCAYSLRGPRRRTIFASPVLDARTVSRRNILFRSFIALSAQNPPFPHLLGLREVAVGLPDSLPRLVWTNGCESCGIIVEDCEQIHFSLGATTPACRVFLGSHNSPLEHDTPFVRQNKGDKSFSTFPHRLSQQQGPILF